MMSFFSLAESGLKSRLASSSLYLWVLLPDTGLICHHFY